jgi:predicted exporter/lauroyl/myristoyl acyltransferase
LALGLARLRFDAEVLDLLPSKLPVVRGLSLYQQHFANARELIITVRAAETGTSEDTARQISGALLAHKDLVSTATWNAPWTEHPGQAAELLAAMWLNQTPAGLGELASRLAPAGAADTFARAREELATTMSPQEVARLAYDPLGFSRFPQGTMEGAAAFSSGDNAFSSKDGTFRVIYVEAAVDLKTYKECDRWLTEVRRIVEETVARQTAARQTSRIGYTGRPAFVAEIAKGMERDITASVGGTSVIIAGLFWLAHRRWKPMLWLLVLLALILGSTLALGALVFGNINVVSMGFAAILLGLAVDYAVVHYQEALAQPELSVPEVRSAIAPSIFWAAATTISAFLVLNFGGLPGLAQLGSLVGLGVALSACVMIFAFLPPLFPDRRTRPSAPRPAANHPPARPLAPVKAAPVLALTAVLLATGGALGVVGLPKMDSTAAPLRPRNSAAYSALSEVTAMLNQEREPLWLIIEGKTEAAVANRLGEIAPLLEQATRQGILQEFVLPDAIWPRTENQLANRNTVLSLIGRRDALAEIARTNGFSEGAMGLADAVFAAWRTAASGATPFWPTNETSRWILNKVSARTPTNCFVLGLLNPIRGSAVEPGLKTLATDLGTHDAILSGWELLGSGIFSSVRSNLWKLVVPMLGLILLSLGLAFRRWKEVLLSIGVMALSGVCLLTVMRISGWSWNLLNLMGLPLILGTGVDYSIFMQLALRRHAGDLSMAHRSVGRALLLCGATAIAGFGSLAWSSNAGMASLGQVCAVGIAGNMLISVFLLPVWWRKLLVSEKGTALEGRAKASSLYRAELWRAGLFVARALPAFLSAHLARSAAGIYWLLARHRRKVVIQNLLPPLGGDRREAKRTARRLFSQFALKLMDLWRFEAGMPIDHLFGNYTGWEHFLQAHEEKRGVLLLTTHLGNWEFGGPWLTRHGFPLQVITGAEPAEALTQLRQASRAKWNIETLVIGEDPFSFLEIIRRLEAGAVVALLVDRPEPRSATTVELFDRPFEGSIAAAELARASGCALVPVYLPRKANQYEAHVLPRIPYDRAALRSPESRHRLTQEILRAFENGIRQNLDQWYHFVPIWPAATGKKQGPQAASVQGVVPHSVHSASSSSLPSA